MREYNVQKHVRLLCRALGLPVLARNFGNAYGRLGDECSESAADGGDGALGFVKGSTR